MELCRRAGAKRDNRQLLDRQFKLTRPETAGSQDQGDAVVKLGIAGLSFVVSTTRTP
jgi:hypothetical protein